ncbi:Siderophore synthetase component [Marininema mesophilum]|uniref:Siderophore synthetase component n=1 Tax=Marininema mesophilum TaxID=1048340 RepID=A0A1H2S8R2_9BACL|nr:IucA/IucC family protein [Marininema mesophilum]SDW28072.1 Siderophore synthetase component [Marininema mesophilum]
MPRTSARQATMQSFFNCYLKEVGNYTILNQEDVSYAESPYYSILQTSPIGKAIHCPLKHHQMEFLVPLRYWSATERHLFSFPFYYRVNSATEFMSLDYVTFIALLTKELTIAQGLKEFPSDLVERIIQSCRQIESFVDARQQDQEELYGTDFHFLDAEQSLIFGHLMHPTPKSRQGLSDLEHHDYSPELKGAHPLHFFRAHLSLIREDSTTEDRATDLIKAELAADPDLSPEFKKEYCGSDEYALLPIHPQQATYLLREPHVQAWLKDGLVTDLGLQGGHWFTTSSLRTLYRPTSKFMLKVSVNIKITNSLRLNKYKELERGVEVSRIIASQIGQEMKEAHPTFQVIEDPAFLTLAHPDQEESGFEISLRVNPFQGDEGKHVSLIAGLCQDAMFDGQSRLARIIHAIAEKEQRSTSEVSMDWFRRYLDLSFEPLIWLYMRYGIALEAHQQNSLIKLVDGYPNHFYYRDNQGYYYCRSTFPELQRILPGIDEKSQTMCEDHVADERFRYYFFQNHLMGLINGFGVAGLVDEELLLSELRTRLTNHLPDNREPSTLLHSLLNDEQIPCKANLLTRVHDMDELVGPMESQSVYVRVNNPLTRGVQVKHELTSTNI